MSDVDSRGPSPFDTADYGSHTHREMATVKAERDRYREIAARALAGWRDEMMSGPPGIDPMRAVRAERWRDLRDALHREGPP